MSETTPSIVIKTPVTKWRRAKNWGDYHMAVLLKKELEVEGYNVLIQILPEWYNDEGNTCDIAIVFRGLSRYEPQSHQINIMWNISHPDLVSNDEYESYDKVFIASSYWTEQVSNSVSTDVETMLQCTDASRFKEPTEEQKKEHHQQILFVGNSRGHLRKVIADLMPIDFDLSIYGKNWSKLISKKYLKGKYIRNTELHKYYGSADILLNDHWDDMRNKGFVSNRLFDGLASGAFIVSDKVKEMGRLSDFVETYETKEELTEKISHYLKYPEERLSKVTKGREYVLSNHTFKDRAKQFSVAIDNFILKKNQIIERTTECNICGCNEFKEGPLGRLTKLGEKPHCVECGSLERHRLIRTVWEKLPLQFLNRKKALQFSLDPSVDSKWFEGHETSIYGHSNTLDLQNIERADKTYDVVICNQILEHVADDKLAFSEILRVMKDDGFLQMTVPLPIQKKVTDDWGYPKEDFHGHYRHYGIDLIEYFSKVLPGVHMINCRARDEVTAVEDFVFFWMKSKDTRDYLLDQLAGKVEIDRYF
ncbi:glycosyltransferase [Cocleimonas sp. KMM 6892]|uniref:glycosyltransferase family protein n=1 Tax=unclassified Cocleimonas TaxID=2639732 RepID=UPI002DB97000|nr:MULTISPECIES: glycosyltransferase [unclassified Cocleimonas]MEB8430922.1 glycosyltransferase [Cocleimonas sp. KMM 6892]MEC4714306.1 glycosyltransferase [Cocleimonas sp. KMM 6895]MEC4743637.1 glycosyltransferase [Cocleimonas sp. KMM 6896]